MKATFNHFGCRVGSCVAKARQWQWCLEVGGGGGGGNRINRKEEYSFLHILYCAVNGFLA